MRTSSKTAALPALFCCAALSCFAAHAQAATHAALGHPGFAVFSGHAPHVVSPTQQARINHQRFRFGQFGGEGLPQLYSGTIEIPPYDEAAGDEGGYDDETGAVLPPIYMIPRVRSGPRCIVPRVIELGKTAEHHKLPKVTYGATNPCPPWVLEAQH